MYNLSEDFIDFLRIKSQEKRLVNRYKDKKRIEIQNTFPLTKDQENSIDEYYQKYYGEKVSYDCHRNFAAHTGVFIPDYFPDWLYSPHFEHFMNLRVEYVRVFENKNVLPYIAKAAGVRMPQTILSCTSGIYRDSDDNLVKSSDVVGYLSNIGRCFCKPTVGTCSGKGVFSANFVNGVDVKTNKPISELIVKLGRDFVIQELITNHKDISSIYGGGVIRLELLPSVGEITSIRCRQY